MNNLKQKINNLPSGLRNMVWIAITLSIFFFLVALIFCLFGDFTSFLVIMLFYVFGIGIIVLINGKAISKLIRQQTNNLNEDDLKEQALKRAKKDYAAEVFSAEPIKNLLDNLVYFFNNDFKDLCLKHFESTFDGKSQDGIPFGVEFISTGNRIYAIFGMNLNRMSDDYFNSDHLCPYYFPAEYFRDCMTELGMKAVKNDWYDDESAEFINNLDSQIDKYLKFHKEHLSITAKKILPDNSDNCDIFFFDIAEHGYKKFPVIYSSAIDRNLTGEDLQDEIAEYIRDRIDEFYYIKEVYSGDTFLTRSGWSCRANTIALSRTHDGIKLSYPELVKQDSKPMEDDEEYRWK